MTMDFTVTEGVDIGGLKDGDRIRFTLKKDGDRWVITAIERQP